MVGRLVTFPPNLFQRAVSINPPLSRVVLSDYLSALRNIEEPAAKCTRAAVYNNAQL